LREFQREVHMSQIFKTIQMRHSVRTYDPRPIEAGKLSELRDFMDANIVGPFGNTVNCKITSLPADSESELKKYVSYGNVTGARYFIAGCVKKSPHAMEDFGYCMEKNILHATSLGLATVWLGGSLNRSTFAAALSCTDDDLIPAITPLGYAADRRSMMDRVIKTLSGGKKRKDFGELFFSGSDSVPLDKSVCGAYTEVLEAVRLAPSARNLQPWRIIREKDSPVFHFFVAEAYDKEARGEIRLADNDLGIAMCHFASTAREEGLSGVWCTEMPSVSHGNWKYVTTWIDTGANPS